MPAALTLAFLAATLALAGLALAQPVPPTTAPTTVPAGEAMRFTGSVVDADTGQPVAGASVVVHRTGLDSDDAESPVADDETLTTDAAGRFAFDVSPELRKPERRLYLELDVRHPDYASRVGEGYGLSLIERDLALGNKPWFSRIEIRRGEAITGRLLDPAGKPAANVPIQYSSVASSYERRMVTTGPDRVDDRTTTDADGRFRFNAVRGAAIACFWAKPADAAILFHDVRDLRGDLGTFRLQPGIAVPGVARTFDGKPAAGVGVRLQSIVRNEVMNEVAERYAETAADGTFRFEPVPPGAYELAVTNVVWNEATRTKRIVELPGAFEPTRLVVDYKDYNRFPPVEIRAVESVTVALQYVDSAGKPRRGHSVNLFGRRGGDSYLATGRPDANGRIAMLVPKGLGEVQISLSTDPYSALRWRRGKDGPLQVRPKTDAGETIRLGTLDADVPDLFIVRYDAPVLVVRGIDADGKPVPTFRPGIHYPGEAPTTRHFRFFDGVTGDVRFDRQDDGSWRTSQLLPDVELRVGGVAEGYAVTPQAMTLREKETREVTVRLTPAATTRVAE